MLLRLNQTSFPGSTSFTTTQAPWYNSTATSMKKKLFPYSQSHTFCDYLYSFEWLILIRLCFFRTCPEYMWFFPCPMILNTLETVYYMINAAVRAQQFLNTNGQCILVSSGIRKMHLYSICPPAGIEPMPLRCRCKLLQLSYEGTAAS